MELPGYPMEEGQFITSETKRDRLIDHSTAFLNKTSTSLSADFTRMDAHIEYGTEMP